MSNKVLVVDDSQDTLNLIMMGVEAYNPPFTMITAKSAKEATELLNSENFDAVILDVSLPDITGTVLGEIIRKSFPNIPIAFLTNYNGPETVVNAEEIGAKFWYKPEVLDDFDSLTNCITKLLENKDCSASADSLQHRNFNLPNSFHKN